MDYNAPLSGLSDIISPEEFANIQDDFVRLVDSFEYLNQANEVLQIVLGPQSQIWIEFSDFGIRLEECSDQELQIQCIKALWKLKILPRLEQASLSNQDKEAIFFLVSADLLCPPKKMTDKITSILGDFELYSWEYSIETLVDMLVAWFRVDRDILIGHILRNFGLWKVEDLFLLHRFNRCSCVDQLQLLL